MMTTYIIAEKQHFLMLAVYIVFCNMSTQFSIKKKFLFLSLDRIGMANFSFSIHSPPKNEKHIYSICDRVKIFNKN